MSGKVGCTGKYKRTAGMLANYSWAARHRNYTSRGRRKLSKARKRLYATGYHPCSGKHWQIDPKKLKKRKLRPGNHTGHTHSEETKRRISEIKKKQFKNNPELVKGAIKGGTNSRRVQDKNIQPTSIEQKLYTYLDKLGVQFTPQKSIGNKLYRVDAYIPTMNLAIEVDGTYWHSLKKAIKADARKDTFIESIGMNLLRIPENCIRNGTYKKLLRYILKEIL